MLWLVSRWTNDQLDKNPMQAIRKATIFSLPIQVLSDTFHQFTTSPVQNIVFKKGFVFVFFFLKEYIWDQENEFEMHTFIYFL